MDGTVLSARYGNAEQWVCHNLRRWILDGTLRANEEINQQGLATRLGVSRSPVRDALRRLEGMGLVTINPNQRAVVTSFTLDNMREIFEMRAALEGLAAFHAVQQISDSDLIELEALADILPRLPDLESYLDKHEAFHDLIAARSGMPRLQRDLARLREMATPYIRIYASGRDSAELIGERHDGLVRVLSLRNPEKASAALASHSRTAYEQLAAEVLRLTKQQAEGVAKGSSESHRPPDREPRREKAAANVSEGRPRFGRWRNLNSKRARAKRSEKAF